MRIIIFSVFIFLSFLASAQYVNIDNDYYLIKGKDSIPTYLRRGGISQHIYLHNVYYKLSKYAYAKEDYRKEKPDTSIATSAYFPGGYVALMKTLYSTIKYPNEWLKKRIEDDVQITLKISREGTVINSTLKFNKEVLYSTKEEIISKLKTLKFHPATIDGKEEEDIVYIHFLFKQKNGVPIDYNGYVIEMNRIVSILYYQDGVYEYSKGRMKSAYRTFNKAIQLCNTDSSYFFNRSVCKLKLGDKYGACLDFDSAIALNHPKASDLKSRFCNENNSSNKKIDPTFKEAQPSIGFDELLLKFLLKTRREFLINNLIFGEQDISGIVVLKFDIDEFGIIDSNSLKIISKVSPLIDKHAINFLFKYGRKWIPAYSKNNPVKSTVVYPIDYQFIFNPGLSPEQLIKDGNESFEKGDYKSALLDYNNVLRKDPFNYNVWLKRIHCKNKLGMKDEICKDIELLKIFYIYEVNLEIDPKELGEIYCN